MTSKEKIKISCIGAGGNIGQIYLSNLCLILKDNCKVEIVLIGSGSDDSLTRLSAVAQDLKGSIYLNKNKDINLKVTNDYNAIKDSNIVICTAAKWSKNKEDEKKKTNIDLDRGGRLKQSYLNKNMVENIVKNVNQNCPDTLLVIVTNQVDQMCYIARNIAPKLKIIGLTGAVDSPRFKIYLKNTMNIDCECFIIGYHNDNMFPLMKSIKDINNKKYVFPLLSQESENLDKKEEENLNKIMKDVIDCGKNIHNGKIKGKPNAGESGATLQPALAIVKLINAYCFDEKFIESWNVRIEDKCIAEFYGIEVNDQMSVPVLIEKNNIKILSDIPLLQREKDKLKTIKEEFKKEVEKLINAGVNELIELG